MPRRIATLRDLEKAKSSLVQDPTPSVKATSTSKASTSETVPSLKRQRVEDPVQPQLVAPKRPPPAINMPSGPGASSGDPSMDFWVPLILKAPGTPIFRQDSIIDRGVATGLSEAYRLPKDMQYVRKKDFETLQDQCLSHLGQATQHCLELIQRCYRAQSTLRGVEASRDQAMDRMNELRVNAGQLEARIRSLEAEKVEGTARIVAQEQALLNLRGLLEAKEAELNEVIEAKAALQKEAEGFQERLDAEYYAGGKDALANTVEELPGIRREEWVLGYKSAWQQALRAAGVDPSSELFGQGDPDSVAPGSNSVPQVVQVATPVPSPELVSAEPKNPSPGHASDPIDL